TGPGRNPGIVPCRRSEATTIAKHKNITSTVNRRVSEPSALTLNSHSYRCVSSCHDPDGPTAPRRAVDWATVRSVMSQNTRNKVDKPAVAKGASVGTAP